MGKLFTEIDEHLRGWIAKQSLYFVATAPLAGDGHVNVSPKGPIGTLRVLDQRTIAYLDIVGSGAETIAHLRENGRIVVMLCAFAGPPRIVRLHGRGAIVQADDQRFAELAERCDFEQPAVAASMRAIITIDVDRISDSCGFGVPLMHFEGLREHGDLWAQKRLRTGGADALIDYQRQHNYFSIDGLPAVDI